MRPLSPRRALVLLLGMLTGWGISPMSFGAQPTAQHPATISSTSVQQSSGQPAVWIQHDVVVHLENLPKRYSCDDLWYKFRDVLLELGARPNLQILAYRCESVLGAIARSPSVHLHFEMPQAVQGKEVRWADMRAQSRTVRLQPGRPASMDSSDCELLRQIKSGLLPALPDDHVVSYQLACQASSPSPAGFSLSVQVLTPPGAADTRLASSSQSVPKLAQSTTAPDAAHFH